MQIKTAAIFSSYRISEAPTHKSRPQVFKAAASDLHLNHRCVPLFRYLEKILCLINFWNEINYFGMEDY